MLHGGIVERNHRLRDQTHHRNVHCCCGQLVLQRLRQQVSDFSLAGCAAHIQGLTVDHVGGAFRAQQLSSHLRPIAVSDHQVMSHPHQAHDSCRGPAGVGQLLRDGAFLSGTDQGVAANRYQSCL
jgi:hypothetical protein